MVIAAMFSFSWYIYRHKDFLAQYRPWAGYANWVTMLRLVFIFILAFVYQNIPDIWMAIILAWLIIMDIIDGFLARKLKLSSDFGLYLDMESDAYFVCMCSLMLYFGGYLPWWILVVGFMRYLNVAVFYLFQLPPKKEPKRWYASYIAGFLFWALLAPYLMEKKWYLPIVAIASILVTASFIISFVQYLRLEDE